MSTSKLKTICFVLSLFFATGVCVFAESGSSYDQFNLSFEDSDSFSDSRRQLYTPGAFRLSLDSQILEPGDTSEFEPFAIVSRTEIVETFSDAPLFHMRAIDLTDNQETGDTGRIRGNLPRSYLDNSIGFNTVTPEGFEIRTDTPRLTISGKFEQQTVIPVEQTPVDFDSLRGSVISRNRVIDRSEHPEGSMKSSRYHFEATYSFVPSVKGKVSYERSSLDANESEKKLQLEGIVKSGRNMRIKAGYNTEVRPDVTEPKTTTDTKVWTEFILKF